VSNVEETAVLAVVSGTLNTQASMSSRTTKFHVLAVLSGAATHITWDTFDNGRESSCFVGEEAVSAAEVNSRVSFLRTGVWKEISRRVRGEDDEGEDDEGKMSIGGESFCRFGGGRDMVHNGETLETSKRRVDVIVITTVQGHLQTHAGRCYEARPKQATHTQTRHVRTKQHSNEISRSAQYLALFFVPPISISIHPSRIILCTSQVTNYAIPTTKIMPTGSPLYRTKSIAKSRPTQNNTKRPKGEWGYFSSSLSLCCPCSCRRRPKSIHSCPSSSSSSSSCGRCGFR
jgi:hypothetical protein